TGGATLTNNGSWLDQNAFDNGISAAFGGTTTFNNNGSYTKSGAGTTTVSTAFNNTNTVAGTGVVAVNAGSLLLTGGLTNFSGSTLTGGRFAVVGASTLSFNGANVVTNAADIVLDGVGSQILNASTSANGLANLASNTAAGRFSILNGRNFTTAGAFANAGVVSVGAASTFTTNGAFTNATGAELQMAGGSFAATSLGSAGTVVGFGTVSPAVANSGTVRAGGGTLTLAAGAQGAAGTVAVNPGATLALGAASTAGNLLHNGTLLALGASSITVFGDYDNAGFGVGNAFDRRANVSGSGQILAAGSVQQQLGGADVSGGTTANATLALPTIRVGQGGISSSFTVLNAGSGSPSLRGAIVTTGISNAGLSGSGVTAQNWGAIAQGGPGQSFTVSFDPAFGQALSGQVLQLVNNFDNVAGQTLTITGQAFNLAAASPATPNPVVLANQRVGGTLSQALAISNTAPASGFSESLNATIAASGTATAGGSFSLLAAGATSTALFVGVDTATAGAKSGVATITLASDGTGTSGFSPFALTAQTVDVSGSVYRLASASAVTPSPVVLADQRVGGTLRQSLTLGNTATADGFSERLSASLTALGDAVATGSISLLAAGSSSTALAVGIDATTAGAKSGSVLVTLASDGAGTSGFAPFALPSQSLTVTGNVYRLAQPVVDTTPLVLASRVGGPTLQAGIGIVNVAPDAFTERLNARIAASPAGTVPGADLVLNPGASGNLALTLPTTTAGLFSGTVDVALVSSSAGTTSGAPDAPLGTTPVSFTGRVYAPAMAQVGALVVDFGIVRVGDTVAARSLSVGNTATGALTDTLRASLSGGGAPFTAGGTVAGLAAGATDTTGLQVQLATGTAGVFSGQAQVQLTSQNPHLADLPLTAVDVTLQAQVNALARGVLSLAGGGASFSGSGTSYTLDFGTVFTDAVSLSASLVLGNAATGTADALAGGWNLGAGGGAFSLTGFDSFAGLAAGGTLGGLTVSFDIGTEGTFDRVIVLNTLSTNGSGPNLALDDITLHLQGQVVPIPEPGTYLMMALGLLAIGGMGWRRQRAQRD
ncbi:MAG: choice-of-anchor D domain-containing protein, partial [Burkholderiaceae bacterium]|nr:choice-of-anchor D domain-containing protein [Burkholderiaceae bacterium]